MRCVNLEMDTPHQILYWDCQESLGNVRGNIGVEFDHMNIETQRYIKSLKRPNFWGGSLYIVYNFKNIVYIELVVHRKLQSLLPGCTLVDVGKVTARQRMIKSKEEIEVDMIIVAWATFYLHILKIPFSSTISSMCVRRAFFKILFMRNLLNVIIFSTENREVQFKRLPKAQQTWGLSSAYQSNFFRSYCKFLHKSWSNFIFRISTKHQHQNWIIWGWM